jgi:L-threonylcarbamoyladenylate synthase
MTDRLAPDADGIAGAARILAGGGLVAFPTDTVYGVAVTWAHADRLAALYALKARPVEKQIAALVADIDHVAGVGWVADDRAMALAARFWPGPLTLVLGGSLGPSGPTQGFRAPDHPITQALVRAAGPLLATSANRSGEPDTLDADDVMIAFATQQDALDAVVDGGRVPGGVASTVLDLTVTPALILREGPLARTELGAVVDVA